MLSLLLQKSTDSTKRSDTMNTVVSRFFYVRYSENFAIGISGSRRETFEKHFVTEKGGAAAMDKKCQM